MGHQVNYWPPIDLTLPTLGKEAGPTVGLNRAETAQKLAWPVALA